MLLRDTLVYIVAKLVPGALGLTTTALLTHLLDPQQYGIYGLALLIMMFGATMGFDWIGLAFMRLYEAQRDNPTTIPTFVIIYLMVLLLSVLIAVVIAATGLIPPGTRAVWLVGLWMVWAYAFFELVARFEIASFRPYHYLAMNMTRAVLMLLLTAGAGWLTRDPMDATIGTALALTIASLAYGGRRLNLRPAQFNRRLARDMLGFGLPYAVSMTMTALFNGGVRSLVGIMGGDGALGLYTAAFSLSQNSLALIAAGIGSATYPLAVRAVEAGDAAATRRQLEENGGMIFAIMAPSCLGLALLTPEVASVLVGVHFRGAINSLVPWLSAAAFFTAIRSFYLDHAFQLGKRPNRQMWISGATAALALAGTAVLMPRIGAVGAAMATTFAMIFSCIIAYIFGRSAHPMPLPLKVWLNVLACCCIMAAAVLMIPDGGLLSMIGKVVAGGTAYAAGMVALDILGVRRSLARALLPTGRRGAAVPAGEPR